MATNRVPNEYTFEEYLAYEEESGIRHEFIDGEIYAMSGGSRKHSRIAISSIVALDGRLDESKCQIFNSDMRVKISDIKYVYPDMSVVCGEAKFTDENETTLTNPTLVVEVLSPSTMNYDMGTKAEFYRGLASIQTYLLIDQSRIHVQLYARQHIGWNFREFTSLEDIIPLEAIDCELPLSEVYRGIEFD